MKAVWFQHLKDKTEQDKFRQMVLGSHKVLDRLQEICYNSITSEEKVKAVDYDSPSWSHKQAHLNGRIEAYREIVELLNISDKEK